MVEANPWEFPPLPEDEAQLQDYLDCLIKDRLLPGANYLLEARVRTCQRRIQEFPELKRSISLSASAQDLTQIINARQDADSLYRDGGIFDLSVEEYVQMR